MVADPAIDCLWIVGPNHARLACMEEIVDAIRRGAGTLRAVACEKPLGRNVAEARRMLALAREANLLDGYLENQVFAPAVRRGREVLWARGARAAGRPYLARAAEEHSGPHNAWFWRGELQGGGVLSDMMCHSVEVARFLVTDPAKARASLTPKRVTAQVATLKWSRPEYAAELRRRFGAEVDYQRRPAEDFARVMVEYEDDAGLPVLIEATTSWSFVGPGLRLSMEVLGPEYSMRVVQPRHRARAVPEPRHHAGRGRGPGREAERRDRADADRAQRSRRPMATRKRTGTWCPRFAPASGRRRRSRTASQ